MRAVQQNLRTGETAVVESPAPRPGPGMVLVQSRASLISAGTERMLVDFGKASLLGKARAQPDKVKQVLDKLRTDGVVPTLEAVFNRLDEPLPLGYCNAGIVIETGPSVSSLRPGDRVASNGPHAELIVVPERLCARIPEEVSDEQAAFTVLTSIGLQGIRLVRPELGERVVVYGLGLIGLVTVQLLRASGCEVLGVDLNPARLALAERLGAKVVASGADPVAVAAAWTEGKGVDAVLVTASAKTDDIIHHAATMCRKRGRIVLVGVVGLNLRRADFYDKELAFQVSCSYGPGRYDETYELAGRDYPFGFVRWTEQRNFEAVLAMLASRRLSVEELVTHRFPLSQAPAAYEAVRHDESALGVILQYPDAPSRSEQVTFGSRPLVPRGEEPTLAVLGAGNFSKMTLMPGLSKARARIKYVCDLQGASAAHLARKFHVERAVTDHREVLADAEVDAVIVAVGHAAHARLVCESLQAGKHVFVEKPLVMRPEELAGVVAAAQDRPDREVMVGFNRRFSPHVVKMKELLAGRGEPLAMTMTVNAGAIPAGHWVHDPERGGGRIVGEACHFIDLMVHMTGSRVRSVAAFMMGPGPQVREDKFVMSLTFADGSVGTINYFANGSKAYPKERLEVFSDGRVLLLDNFRELRGVGFRGFRVQRTLLQDKGHAAQFQAYTRHIKTGGSPLISFSDLVNVAVASFAAVQSSREERVVDVNQLAAAYLGQEDNGR